MTHASGPGRSSDSWRSANRRTDDQRSWRSHRSSQPGGTPRQLLSWIKRLLALTGVAITAAAIYLLWSWWVNPPWPTTILVLAQDYDRSPVAYSGLTGPYAEELTSFDRLVDPARKQTVSRISQPEQIAEAPTNGTLILYLYATAVNRLDADGKPELIVVGDDLAGPDSLGGSLENQKSFPLREVWSALGKPRFDTVPKLVFLDLSRLTTDWRMGILQSRLIDKESIMSQIRDLKNLTVVCSADRGERAWGSPQFGQSVFEHFALEAMKSKSADKKHPMLFVERDKKSHTNYLHVSELLAQVVNSTRKWVASNRGTAQPQVPFFASTEQVQAPVSADVPLAAEAADGSWKEQFDSFWKGSPTSVSLLNLWRTRDDVWKAPQKRGVVLRLFPLAWRQFHYEMMRAESLAYAGNFSRAREALERARRGQELFQSAFQTGPGSTSMATLANVIASRDAQPMVDTLFGARLARPGDLLRSAGGFLETRLPRPKSGNSRQLELAAAERSLAEKTACGPLGTSALVGELILAADAKRYLSEDLYFSDRHNDSKVDQTRLEAEELYHAAAERADNLATVRGNLEILLSELPELAFWAANGVGDPAKRARFIDLHSEQPNWSDPAACRAIETALAETNVDRVSPRMRIERQLLGLFSVTRRLLGRWDELSSVRQAAEPRSTDSATAQKNALVLRTESDSAVKMLHGEINDAIELEARRVEQEQGDIKTSHRQEAVDLLNDPLLSADDRLALWQRVIHCDHELFVKPDGAPEARELGDGDWQALWILQVFSFAPGRVSVSSENVSSASRRGPHDVDVSAIVARWKESRSETNRSKKEMLALELERQIRTRWQTLREKVAECADPKQKSVDLENRRKTLTEADRLARIVHGYDASELSPLFGSSAKDHDYSPSNQLARLEIADLFLLNARRHLRGLWVSPAAEGATSEAPWFALISNALLDRAKVSLDEAGVSDAAVIDLRKQVEPLQKASLILSTHVAARPIRLWSPTTSHSADSQLTLQLGKDAVGAPFADGVPALQLKVPEPNNWSERIEARPAEAVVFQPGSGNAPSAFVAARSYLFPNSTAPSGAPGECKTVSVVPTAFFRGRFRQADAVELDPCRPEPRIVNYTPIEDRSATLRVTGVDRRNIIFILDCSGSMVDKMSDNRSRFDHAKEALRNAVQLLDAQNPKPQVGLIAYGHRAKRDQGKDVLNETWKDDPPPDAYRDFQSLIRIAPLSTNKAEFVQLFGWLPNLNGDDPKLKSKLEPWGQTPLVGSVEKAWEESVQNSVDAIVVITDGGPNDSVDWDERFKKVQERLAAGKVALRIVEIFDEKVFLKDLEEGQKKATAAKGTKGEQAWADWVRGIKDEYEVWTLFEKICRDHHNDPVRAATPVELKQAVLGSLVSRRDVVIAGKTTGSKEEHRRLEDLSKSDLVLDVGDYTVFFGEFRDRAFPLPLHPGDHVSLALDWNKQPGSLVRQVKTHFRYTAPVSRPGVKEDPMWVGVESYKFDGSAHESRFAIRFGRDSDDRIVRRPSQVDIRVRPEGDDTAAAYRPRRVDWSAIGGELPGWRVKIPNWPGGVPARLEVSWVMTDSAPDAHWGWAELQREGQSFAIPNSANRFHIKAERTPKGEAAVTVVAETSGSNPLSVEQLSELDRLRIRVGRTEGNEFVSLDCACSREMLDEDGTSTVKFQIDPQIPIEKLEVGVTFDASWRRDAVTLAQPLIAAQTDEITK